MARQFSPYGYKIKYRNIGKNPNQSYSYVGGAGLNAPVFTSSKVQSKYFSYVKSVYTIYLNEATQPPLSSLISNKTYFISQIDDQKSYQKVNIIDEDEFYYKQFKKDQLIKKQNLYQVQLNTNYKYDSIILYNGIYIDNKCQKFYSNKSAKFMIPEEYDNDSLLILIYSLNHIFSKFKFDSTKSYSINDKINIQNLSGTKNIRCLFKKINSDKILKLNNFDISQQSISFNIENPYEIDFQNSLGYQTKYPLTFIIHKNISNQDVIWNNNLSVTINHALNDYINFILDDDNINKVKYNVIKIDKNKLKIQFQNQKEIPNVFTIICFKIGE